MNIYTLFYAFTYTYEGLNRHLSQSGSDHIVYGSTYKWLLRRPEQNKGYLETLQYLKQSDLSKQRLRLCI